MTNGVFGNRHRAGFYFSAWGLAPPEGKEDFFFEKKKQKTFVLGGRR